ncbi:MAG: CvpA family protein [Phycisphaerales bacterium]|nr:CvpA family protein [Phycisphaerales bacterium]
MIFSLLILAFLGAVAYFQAIQGATSAIITAVLTVLCVALSFGTYEAVAEVTLLSVTPDFARPICFMAMFLVPLFVLRIIMDMLVSRANMIPHLLDRVVAAAVGLCTAFLMTGMLAIGLQMLPWPSLIGFSRFDAKNPSEQHELFLRPDRAAASFGIALTNGVFGGGDEFHKVHPDLVTDLGWVQAGLAGVRRTAPADSITCEAAGEIQYVYDGVAGRGSDPNKYTPVEPKSGNHYLRVLLKVNGSADDLGDADKKLRFAPATVRLVGERDGKPEIYCAIAVPSLDQANYFIRSWEGATTSEPDYVAGLTLAIPDSKLIEVAFEVPTKFKPRSVYFRVGGVAPYRGGHAPEPVAEAPTSTPEPTPPPSGGRTSGVKFKSSHFGDDFPMAMTAYQGQDVESAGNVMEQGQLIGLLDDQGSANRNERLDRFKVPDGKVLLQLNVESLQAGSLLGKALNQAATTVEDYNIVDSHGAKIGPIGKYAVAKVGDDYWVELMYFPGYAASGARAIRPFSKIQHTHLRGDYQLMYLYVVDSGTRIVEFDPGGGKHKTDLSGQNLVAP